MTALILAAGFGSRLMPLTANVPKCLVQYQGKPILDYVVTALRASGIEDIHIVGGYLISELVTHAKQLGIQSIFENPNFDCTNMVASFFCARDLLEQLYHNGQDLLVSYADIVYEKAIVHKLMEAEGDLRIVVDKQWLELWKRRFADPLSEAESLKCNGDFVIELGKTPSHLGEIEGQYIGLFVIRSSFLGEVLRYYDSLDRTQLYDGKDFTNMYMTSFLQCLINTYNNARAVFINGGWCEIDHKTDLDVQRLDYGG